MQDLVFKNNIKFWLFLLIGLIGSFAASHIPFNYVEIPIPLLILGTFAAFLAGSFLFYPKATTGQSLQVAITGILINAFILVTASFASKYFNLSDISIKPEFILYLNPLVVGNAFLLSVLALCSGFKIEEVQQPIEETAEKQEEPEKKKTPETQPKSMETKIPLEIHKIENKNEEPDDSETLDPLEPVELEDSFEEKSEPEEKQVDYIPTDIRLVQTMQAKDKDQKAKIGSIGQLLVNNKNLENLIESEEILNSKTNVITTVSGQHIYEKFNELKDEFTYIKEMALIDNGGFIIANNFEDPQRVQIAGALISGAYMTIQNYLSQINIILPVRIFFETDQTNSFIVKTKEELLFSIWNKDVEQVEYGPMKELFEAEDISTIDIMPYADLMKIESFSVADSEGNLLNSFGDNQDPQLFAAVSSAIFENLKVFLMNIRLFNLSKIVIFTPKKTLTIVKPEDKIISFLTDAEEHPKVSEKLLKLEEI